MNKHRLALIGGRGHAGAQLLELIAGHPQLELALASSGSRAGAPIISEVPAWPDEQQTFSALSPERVGSVDTDVWVLALPNGHSKPWVEAIDRDCPEALVLDLGADWRFDSGWVYGLTELRREALRGARRIANPGCYSSGALFGLWPLREWLVAPPVIFGVSGYSGAGKTPSPRNDPARLANNLIPYALTGHMHEREISTHLGHAVRFHPHVAPFFRGISLTISVTLDRPVSEAELLHLYKDQYAGQSLIRVTTDAPEVREIAGHAGLAMGGFAVDARNPAQASFVVVLDNLLKGASSQALQNINLALGLEELEAVQPVEKHHG